MTTPRRKACVECRQQKIRCDVEQHKTPHEPCSRCKKMNIECRILPTSTRNLRQTKAEMRRELEELKWGLRHSQEGLLHPAPGVVPNIASLEGGPNQSPMPPGSGAYSTVSARTEGSMSMSPSFQPGTQPPPTSRPGTRNGSIPATGTMPRVLDDFVVDPKRIDDTFTIFFTQYFALLPILDPTLSPNEYYELSPFLFWSIVVTGSRRYTEDPMILDRISQLITPLAFSSMALRSTPIPVIQGLVILCTWRLPTSSMFKDITHVLCGAAVHLATQIGLHVAGVGQDFARMPLKKDQDQKIIRAKLWMHCIIVYIRSSCAEGIPPLVIAEPLLDGDEREREELQLHIPPELQFLYKVHIILLRAMSAMARVDLKSPDCDVGVLRSLISIFDAQLFSLVSSSPSELDTFQLNCARVHVMAFHFFAHPENPDPEALSRLFSLCISTAQTANSLAQSTNLVVTCPSFIDRTITLTGFIILKLVRSQLAQHLDLAAGEQAYFHCVNFSKAMSLQPNDLSARASAIMTSLWGSSRVFRRRDGRIESLGLRLRTRLSMSVSFDMFWYWREEFGNMLNPYSDDKSSVPGDDNSMVSTGHTNPETPRKTDMSLEERSRVDSAKGLPEFEKRDMGATAGPGGSLAGTSKFSVDMQPGAMGGFDPTLNPGYDQNMPPMLDQFLDYDWATNFDFTNDWNNQGPNPGVAEIAPDATGYGPMNFS